MADLYTFSKKWVTAGMIGDHSHRVSRNTAIDPVPPPGPPQLMTHTPSTPPLHVSAPFAPHSAGAGEGGKAVLEIQGLWHPCAVSRVAGDAVVPNDLVLGSQQQNG